MDKHRNTMMSAGKLGGKDFYSNSKQPQKAPVQVRKRMTKEPKSPKAKGKKRRR